MTAERCPACGTRCWIDASVDCITAAEIGRQEAAECRCGAPCGPNVNGDCEWHGGRIWRDIDSGKFWTEDNQ